MLKKDKTKTQQDFHAKMLSDCKTILDKYNIKSILSGSALLGIIRDGDLIPWSPGCILIVDFDKIKRYQNKIIPDLKEKGFKITRHFKKRSNFKIRVDKKIFNIEITGYSHKKDFWWRSSGKRIKTIPDSFFKNTTDIEFKGCIYQAPEKIDKFLTHLYGNWRKVIKSEIRHSYKAQTHTRYK